MTTIAGLFLAMLFPGVAPAATNPVLTATKSSVDEGAVAGKAVVRLTLDRKPSRRVAVDWRTVDGTAVAGHDYVARSGTVVFRPGSGTRSKIVVPVVDDADAESLEKFFVRLSSRAARVDSAKVAVRVKDDDAPASDVFEVALAKKRATSRTFDTAVSVDDPTLKGGRLTAKGPDGSVYTLTVPHGALDRPRIITMTPWKSVAGIATGNGSVSGVDLEPHGITFLRPVRLQVTPPGGADRPAVTFSYDTVSEGPYGYPVRVDPARLVFDLMHFSGYGAVTSETRIDFEEKVPEDLTKAMAAEMERILGEERTAQLAGAAPDPNVMTIVSDLMSAHYKNVVEPTLAGIRTSCADARTNIAAALSFARQSELLGLLTTEADTILDAVLVGVENCLREEIAPCVDLENADQVARIVTLWRQVVLLGGTVPDPGPLDESRQCKRILEGTITMKHDLETVFNGFRTTEHYTLVYNLRMVLVPGSATWYDDGGGTWTVTGSRLSENLPGSVCPASSEETYAASGTFYTEWHTDVISDPGKAIGELSPFSTTADYAPRLRGAALGTSYRTAYEARSGTCTAYETDQPRDKRFPVPYCGPLGGSGGYVYGDIVLDEQGQRAASFNCTLHEDYSDPEDGSVDIQHTEVTGVLVQKLG